LTREKLDLGKLGEEIALKKLKRLGYKQLISNYRCSLGEIDLIAMDGDILVFIEVKTRKRNSIFNAKEAVDFRKQMQISKVALAYIKSNDCFELRVRFDVVAVFLGGKKPEIEVIKNAFESFY